VAEQEFAFGNLMDITERPEIVFVKGHGSWLVDHRGKRYLDFVQGWAVTCLGHCPRVVTEALAAQVWSAHHPEPGLLQRAVAAAGRLLARHSCFSRFFFTNSGAEANEGAIKLARKWGRRVKGGAFEIITFDHGFHGRTLATMSASGKPGWDTMFAPQVDGFPKATLNDLASVEALITDRTAAVMLEPVQARQACSRPAWSSCASSAPSPRGTTACSSPTRSRPAWAHGQALRLRAFCARAPTRPRTS
jgi:acetylornithine/N-succinyldiaminopimelate aminotransferase